MNKCWDWERESYKDLTQKSSKINFWMVKCTWTSLHHTSLLSIKVQSQTWKMHGVTCANKNVTLLMKVVLIVLKKNYKNFKNPSLLSLKKSINFVTKLKNKLSRNISKILKEWKKKGNNFSKTLNKKSSLQSKIWKRKMKNNLLPFWKVMHSKISNQYKKWWPQDNLPNIRIT